MADTALSTLASYVPEGVLAEADKPVFAKIQTNAAKALELLRALPQDPKAAAGAVASIGRALEGDTSVSDAAAATPGFDVLRVEPDGSTVIAGTAAPDAKVEVLNGADVIASTTAGAGGEFAIVLDQPLKPGDYALALRSTTKDGKTAMSGDVASVSVPKSTDGEVLAMISKPGAASEIVTPPIAESAAGGKMARVPADASTASAAPDAGAAAAPAQTANADTARTTYPQTPKIDQTSTAATGPKVQVTAVEIEGDKIFIAGTSSLAGTVLAFADDISVGSAKIAEPGHFVIEGKQVLSVGKHTIRVDLTNGAGKMLVRATVPFDRPAGSQLAAVAASGDQNGEAPRKPMVPMELGAFDKQRDTLARAFAILSDLFANGKQPSQEDVAAARSSTELALRSLVDFRPGAEASRTVVDAAQKTAKAASKAYDTLHDLPASVDAVASAMPEIARLIDRVLKAAPVDMQATPPVSTEPVSPPQVSMAEPQPTPGAPAASQQSADTTPAPQADRPEVADATTPAPATGSDTANSSADQDATAAPTLQQAELQPSQNSVIIRKGDTLWQISRRVYGEGVRYTTIYLANETQIHNPDLIEPGQIFAVPHDALPDAEEIHRRRLQHLPLR